MSVAFTKEESAETASETVFPDRPISPHPNLVTERGLQALQRQWAAAEFIPENGGGAGARLKKRAKKSWHCFESLRPRLQP